MKRLIILITFQLLVIHFTKAQNVETLKIRKFREDNSSRLLEEYNKFLKISNLAIDKEGLELNAKFIMTMMKDRGLQNIQLLKANSLEVPPSIYGEVMVPNAKKTLIFYAHYDGQPVNPSQWAKGLAPFNPKLYSDLIEKGGKEIALPSDNKFDANWRFYGRSSSDDKAGIAAILFGYESLIKSGQMPNCNLKFFFEGEEEKGSPHLNEILDNYKSLLSSDLWIICDGPIHQSEKKQVLFGVRGDSNMDLTVYGPKRPLHSGHYGNWAPNPALMLAKLLSSMKDENGKVLIKGFYDDVQPLSKFEKQALDQVPSVDEQMKKELGIKNSENPSLSLNEAINLPSLNINGIQSGNIGKMASNQIPTFATAVLDLRLVLGNDFKRQQQKVKDHIVSHGYYITEYEPTDEERNKYTKIIKIKAEAEGINAQRTSMELPIVKQVIEILKSGSKDQIVLQPTMGGSLPLYLFEKHLNAKTLTIPIANHDNNQHAENENLRLGNLFDGIETMGALMLLK